MKFNRLSFLRILGLDLSAAVIKACSTAQKTIPTSLPTDTHKSPMISLKPSPTILCHITPEMILVKGGDDWFLLSRDAVIPDTARSIHVFISANGATDTAEVLIDDVRAYARGPGIH